MWGAVRLVGMQLESACGNSGKWAEAAVQALFRSKVDEFVPQS